MKWKIELERKKLDKLFEKVQLTEDEEIQAYLAKFLCVRTSGFLESSIKNLVTEYLEGAVPKSVQKFILHEIKNLSNLTYERIISFLAKFNAEWCLEFENSMTEQKKSSLGAVVANRHLIAHGGNDNISFHLMNGYYHDIKEIVEDLSKIISK